MPKKEHVLVIDDDPSIRGLLSTILMEEFTVSNAETAEDGLRVLEQTKYPVVLLDIELPGMNGIEALKHIKANEPYTEVIIITSSQQVGIAVEAMKQGAYDFFTKPFGNEKILKTVRQAMEGQQLRQEVAYLRDEVRAISGYGEIVGKSPQIQQVIDLITEMAKTDVTVLVQGNSGTGKELVARAIHTNGTRQSGPFVAVNCAAIPHNLLESELFGYEKGSFTGAVSAKAGKMELAHNGTLFLDEISSLPLDMQAKLLRVIQEGEMERVGGTKTIKLNLRLITATNIELKKAVAAGMFREDLFFRLNVIPLNLPSLTARTGDIPLLINHFIRMYNKKYTKQVQSFSGDALEILLAYPWPGNVRELKNLVERVVVLSGERTVIGKEHLPMDMLEPVTVGAEDGQSYTVSSGSTDLQATKNEVEKKMLVDLLGKHNGNQSKVARVLGVHRNTVVKKIKKYSINVKKVIA